MPNSIVIIDDRTNRPYLHLSEDTIRQLKNLPNVFFASNKEDVNFNQFDIIAIHRSYVISANLSDELDNLIKEQSKYLILFSGGIGHQAVIARGHKAIVGSEVFYSSNLLPFCEDLSLDGDIQLYKLLYGINSWRLPILMRLRQLYWLDPNEENVDVDDEKEEIKDALGIDSKEALETEINHLILTL